MLVRIIKPLPPVLEDYDTSRFDLDRTYELHAPLSDVLIVGGYGIPQDEPPRDRSDAIKALAGAQVTRGSFPHPENFVENRVQIASERPTRRRASAKRKRR